MKQEAKAALVRGILAALALLFAVGAALVYKSILAGQKSSEETLTPQQLEAREDKFYKLLKFTQDQLVLQRDVEQSIRAEQSSGAYTLEEPLVVVNPYEISPLTAIVAFQTEEPTRIFVHVPGKDRLADVDFLSDVYETDHVVPIYGLYADTVNPVLLICQTEDGSKRETTVEITTEPLPDRVANIVLIADAAQPEQYLPGLNFMYENKAAFDINGDFRWFLKGDYRTPTNYDYDNGHFMVIMGSSYKADSVLYLEIDPLGKIYRVLYAPYACHHDIELMEGGNLLLTGSEGETVEDLLYEMNPETGEIVQKLDLKTIFPRMREGLTEPEHPDWLHLNDIVWLQQGTDILISSRNQSFVARITWPDGAIKWILAEHKNWPEMFEKYLLTPIGDDFEWSYNQHAPYVLPDQDNNPDTMDLLVYDNGNQRPGTDETDQTEHYSRIVHYQIDERQMTIRQVWQYGKELGEALYANSRGNVILAENGNLIASYCMQAGETYHVQYREIDKNFQLIWQVEAFSKAANGKLVEYRVTRKQIYNDSANVNILDIDAVNLIPSEVLENYGLD